MTFPKVAGIVFGNVPGSRMAAHSECFFNLVVWLCCIGESREKYKL